MLVPKRFVCTGRIVQCGHEHIQAALSHFGRDQIPRRRTDERAMNKDKCVVFVYQLRFLTSTRSFVVITWSCSVSVRVPSARGIILYPLASARPPTRSSDINVLYSSWKCGKSCLLFVTPGAIRANRSTSAPESANPS